jgi:hypothetical protein
LFLRYSKTYCRGLANIGELESSKLVAVNADKIKFFIQNVNSFKGC